MKTVLTAFLASIILSASPAAADPAVQAGKAKALAAGGKHVEALGVMREAYLEMWVKTPMTFGTTVFVAKKGAAFGVYTPRKTNVFKQNEPILIYAEPIGYHWKKTGDIYLSDMAADVVLKKPDGSVIGGKSDFGHFTFKSRVRNTEYMVNLNYAFTGMPKGKYVVTTTLRDLIGKKSGKFDLPFEIK